MFWQITLQHPASGKQAELEETQNQLHHIGSVSKQHWTESGVCEVQEMPTMWRDKGKLREEELWEKSTTLAAPVRVDTSQKLHAVTRTGHGAWPPVGGEERSRRAGEVRVVWCIRSEVSPSQYWRLSEHRWVLLWAGGRTFASQYRDPELKIVNFSLYDTHNECSQARLALVGMPVMKQAFWALPPLCHLLKKHVRM